MTDLRNQLVRSVAMTGDHLRLVKHERTLAHVLLEISEAGPIVWGQREREWALLDHEQRGAALDRLDDLQAEARQMIEQMTGCSWERISYACL